MAKRRGELASSAGTFEVALAEPADAETVRILLTEAAEWMRANGIGQWSPEQFTEEVIASYFAGREIYMILTETGPAGMFTLQAGDPDYWGALNDEAYNYLHRLTVRPYFRGRALGKEMIYWAAKHSRETGRKGLRFDCWDQNRKLNPYYRELGMEEKGIGRLNGRQYILYEMNGELFQTL
ncbi:MULTISPECIES: GNAT family N-acetyltransferase [Paenibacillus]|uniref:GNAT family N-acetyltransferase n=1 Tax=Paenibacillus TaxID=44249 RepID=UPI002FE15157